MKVIFLDIDGVLNTGIYAMSVFHAFKIEGINPHGSKAIRDEHGSVFDPVAVRNLEKIIKETGAKIVISSMWRFRGIDVMKKIWEDRKLPGEIIGVTPIFKEESLIRGEEIADWISENGVDSYVIIDDDDDMNVEQLLNFVQTSSIYGLTDDLANKCIQILNRKQ